ncbi:hypothetical protein K491DRAFT_693899 [Lophiostoma macrostomum CBS 122681]|uniref:Uncharacterized protein n=1 Tax=Lophiostoma macrostomum CBS 122681 TaxID=1314788 RepID=A0A6A6T3M0_9PLEO|nr:hypothetical protein K491DRAFT_693899 [Lophiostoma macrostomum CBS 122681]
MTTAYPHPNNPTHTLLDPTASGTVLQYALAIESTLNLIFATYILLLPTSFLSFLTPSTSTPITPLSTTLAQLFALMIYTLTIPMLLAIPNTRRGIELRAPVYTYLGLSEVMLIGLFVYLGLGVGAEASGISGKAVVAVVGNLVPPCLFRWYVLGVRPEWMGRYRDVGKLD